MSCAVVRFIGDLKTVYEDGWTTVYWCDGQISTIIGEVTPDKYMFDADWYYHSEPKPTDKLYNDLGLLVTYLQRCYHSDLEPTKTNFNKWKLIGALR